MFNLKKFNSVLFWIIFAIVALNFVSFLYYSFTLFLYPYDWEESEGDSMHFAWMILQGENPYSDNVHLPITAFVYPPFYHLLLAPLIYIFGFNIAIGRIVSFLAILILSFLIYIIINQKLKDWKISLFFSLLPFSSKFITPLFSLARQNTLWVLLAFLGLYFILKYREGNKYVALSILFLILAVYTKQLAIFAPLAVMIWLFFQNKKMAFYFTTIFGSISFFIFLLIQRLSQNLFFYNVVIFPNIITIKSFYHIFWNISNLFLAFFVFIFLVAVALFKKKYFKSSLWFLTLVSAILIYLATGANIGGGADYLYPIVVSILLLSGIYFKDFLMLLNENKKAFLYFIILLQLLLHIFIFSNGGFYFFPTKEGFQNAERLDAFIGLTKGDVLMERNTGFLFKNQKKMWVEASIIPMAYRIGLVDSGKWDQNPFLEGIRNKDYSLIVAVEKRPFGSSEVAQVVFNNYDKIDSIQLQKRGVNWTNFGIFIPKQTLTAPI